jgi:hypothetical protein
VEEQLLPGGKHELGAAVDALQYLVLEFHFQSCSLQPVIPCKCRQGKAPSCFGPPPLGRPLLALRSQL